jgi:hypothetical protein
MGPRDTRLAPQGEYNNVCTPTSFYVVWNLDMVGLSGPFQSGTHAVSIVITRTHRIKSGTSQVLRNGQWTL